MRFSRQRARVWVSLWALGLGLSAGIAACGISTRSGMLGQASPTGDRPAEVELTLVSYAVTKSAYAKILPQFAAAWEKKTGQKVIFRESYGGSGSQTRALIDGLEADIAHLALPLDTKKLEKAGLIDAGWESELPNESIVTKSVVALAYRDGNPKHIRGWADVVNPRVAVITANPKTSGVARWNFLAVYGAGAGKTNDKARAEQYVAQFYRNAKVLTRDAREATEAFSKQGQGDVLLNYENELLLAASHGEKVAYTIPSDVNISIDSPVVVVDANVKKRGTKEVAQAFAEFLFTPAAQREFAHLGFRPVVPEIAAEFAAKYPKIETLNTAQSFGGWDKIQTDFFADGALFDRVQAALGK